MAKHSTKRDRKKTPRYVRLEHWLLDSSAWQSLTPQARVVYTELCKIYNGVNNGGIALSNRDAATRCNISKDTAGNCLQRLAEIGFTKVRTPGGYNQKSRDGKGINKNKASEYELTEYPYLDRQPTKDFMNWKPQPKKKRGHKSGTHCPKLRPHKENTPNFRVVGGSHL